ncbi:hypothetical protein JCM8547_000215 [Rhodosporidiobolus lusitaniae]
MDAVRRIVSGKKARFVQNGFDLDLIQLTDRIIIMGYPADGFASLYRNRRSDVLRFLEPYAPHYRIFNLCPRYENQYDAAVFTHEGVQREGKAVERFPWPDHHPPPLSLMPLMSAAAREWYEADERNVVVIHCKAGKGRSGSFALSLLLALPGLPSAPEVGEKDDGIEKKNNALDPQAVIGKTPEEIDNITMDQKLEYLLRFHTLRRMSPGAKSYGVSIASQRRFLGYFCRLLEGNVSRVPPSLDPPSPPSPRKIVLEYIKITGPGLQGAGKVLSGGKDKMAVQVFRYKDSITADLRRRELALAQSGIAIEHDDNAWDDQDEMFVQVGGFTEGELDTSVNSSSSPSAPPHSLSPPAQTAAVSATAPLAASSCSALSSSKPAPNEQDTASTASASTGSLPSTILATPTSATPSPSNSSHSLPPPSETATTAAASSSSSTRSSRTRTLIPHTAYLPPASDPLDPSTNPSRRDEKDAKRVAKEEGIVLDGDRECQLRFLVGETGKKHGKLPAMASLALCWFIPVFECPFPPSFSSGKRVALSFGAKELDFLKPFANIQKVEVEMRWL